MNGPHPLIDYLTRHAEDRGMLAALRRGLGRPPGGAPEMFPYVIPFVRPEVHRWEEANLYLIASLFAMHPSATSSGNMGAHLRAYARAIGDDQATTRRFVQLMRMRRETLDVPLRQHISLLKSGILLLIGIVYCVTFLIGVTTMALFSTNGPKPTGKTPHLLHKPIHRSKSC